MELDYTKSDPLFLVAFLDDIPTCRLTVSEETRLALQILSTGEATVSGDLVDAVCGELRKMGRKVNAKVDFRVCDGKLLEVKREYEVM